MIGTITLNNLKCFFPKQEFELGKVTVLSGYNGRGKSTLLQSLLLLSQSVDLQNDLNVLRIRGGDNNSAHLSGAAEQRKRHSG